MALAKPVMLYRLALISLVFVFGFTYANAQISSKNKADEIIENYSKDRKSNVSKHDFEQLLTSLSNAKDSCRYLGVNSIYLREFSNANDYKSSVIDAVALLKWISPKCDSIHYVEIHSFLSQIHIDLLDTESAQKDINKAFETYNDNWGNTLTLFKLYSTQGNIHFQDEEYEKALSAYKRAYDVTVELNDQKNIQNASFNMSISQLMLGEVDSATTLLNLSLYAAKEGLDSSSIGKIYNVLAGVNTNFEKRVAYMDSAIMIAKDLNDFVDLHAYYQNLALAYSEEKDYYWAFEYSWISSNYKDSVYKEETANSIAEMMERYESEQKSLEIANLELKNNEALLEAELLKSNQYKLILGSVGLVILLIISLIVIKQTRDHRKMLALKNEAIEIEKERSEELLLNILPYEVAEELKEKGESEAKDFENVTVLFSDFQHFTETAEKLSAKELVKEINSCFKGFDEIMNKYGVEKIKTIGDAYMAAGGLHIPRTTEPIDVVKAGLEMQSFMQARKEQKKKAGEPFFEMRIGIHTGPVVAGIVGVKKFQYDIWGDTVNTAARMESSSEVQKVNISDFTYQILKENPEFQFEDRGEIEVKGKGKIRMWFVALA